MAAYELNEPVKYAIKLLIKEDISDPDVAIVKLQEFLRTKKVPTQGPLTLKDHIDLVAIFVPNTKELFTTEAYLKSYQLEHKLGYEIIPDEEGTKLELRERSSIVRKYKGCLSLQPKNVDNKDWLDSKFIPIFEMVNKIEHATWSYEKYGVTIKYKGLITLRYYYPSMIKKTGLSYGMVRFCRIKDIVTLKQFVPKHFYESDEKTIECIKWHVHKSAILVQIKYFELQEFVELLQYFQHKLKELYDPYHTRELSSVG